MTAGTPSASLAAILDSYQRKINCHHDPDARVTGCSQCGATPDVIDFGPAESLDLIAAGPALVALLAAAEIVLDPGLLYNSRLPFDASNSQLLSDQARWVRGLDDLFASLTAVQRALEP